MRYQLDLPSAAPSESLKSVQVAAILNRSPGWRGAVARRAAAWKKRTYPVSARVRDRKFCAGSDLARSGARIYNHNRPATAIVSSGSQAVTIAHEAFELPTEDSEVRSELEELLVRLLRGTAESAV